MDNAITAEKFEDGTAFSRFECESLAASLWTQENFQTLNRQNAASQLPQLALSSPDESIGAIASGADGFTLFDSRLLAAKDNVPHPKEAHVPYTPAVSAHTVIDIAEKLGHATHRWESMTTGKCNIYLDAVMNASGMPRPWAETGVQSCEKMDEALAADPRYDQVWHMDYSNELIARKNWSYVKPQAGDIVLWNRPDTGIIHVGIADGHGGIYYAGARDPKKHGFGHTKLEYFTGTIENPTNYGAPTAVYRYKNWTD